MNKLICAVALSVLSSSAFSSSDSAPSGWTQPAQIQKIYAEPLIVTIATDNANNECGTRWFTLNSSADNYDVIARVATLAFENNYPAEVLITECTEDRAIIGGISILPDNNY